MQTKKIALINDLSGYGRCSLTVSIPIISAMGIQCCPLPTAILSNHTGYKSYFFDDYTDKMEKYYKEWEKLSIHFDMIYTGFLGSIDQIDMIIHFIKSNPEAIILIDPVMGDGGKIYSTYNDKMCQKMKELIKYATIATPNVTEAFILADKPYNPDYTISQLKKIAKSISKTGPKKVIITGILEKNKITNLIYNKEKSKEFSVVSNEKCDRQYSGTGDLFSSIVAGSIINGISLKKAVKKASKFITDVTIYSEKNKISSCDGVLFEKFIKDIM